MAINSIVKWDNSPKLNHLKIETRMFDMGSISYNKKVSSLFITTTSSSSAIASGVTIGYRINSSDSFTTIGSTILSGSEQRTTQIPISSPIVCTQIQFKIKGISNIEAPIDITDITVIFRPLRKYGSTSGDKES